MRDAFAEIVDYAGLFPPASCSMADAARQYNVYRTSSDRWMLGRFVLAASRLQELAVEIRDQKIIIEPADPWRLSVVMGAHAMAELALIAEFQAEWTDRGVLADTIEFKVNSVGQIRTVAEQIPHSYRRYFEVPATPPFRDLITEIAAAGAMAKIRTGGTSPELFPSAEDLTKFLIAVVKRSVPFKATAGLHHPFRGSFPLTYAPDAERHMMFGFVNLLVATTELMCGGEGETAEQILEESAPGKFVRSENGIRWRDSFYTTVDLTMAHEKLFVGFGSCSFREPVDELALERAA